MIREVQYLRAVAVLMVMHAHASFLREAFGFSHYFDAMGAAGVDIFFVISGYVVSASLFRVLKLSKDNGFIANLEINIPHLKAFFIKRVFRLLPVAFLLIAVNVLRLSLLHDASSSSVTEEIMGLLSHLTMQSDVDTILFTQCENVLRTMNHYWSLAVEERFYLVIPLIMILCGCARRFMVLAVCVILGLGLFKAVYPLDEITMYTSGFLRLDSFMFGILVYLLGEHTNVMKLVFSREYSRVWTNILSIVLLIIIARMPINYVSGEDKQSFLGHPYYYIVVYTLSAILIAMAAQDKGYALHIPALHKALYWIGDRSYNIYVFQFICIGASLRVAKILHIPDNHYWQITGIFLTILLLTSELIYRLWEKPWRDYGRRIARN